MTFLPREELLSCIITVSGGLGDAGAERWLCFCNGPLVVKLKVHPVADFVLLSVVDGRPPLHAV
jgi:hypothetical protein